MMKRAFDAACEQDVRKIARLLYYIPDQYVPNACAAIVRNRLMLGPWWFRLILRWVRWRKPVLEFHYLLLVFRKYPEAAAELIRQTDRHLRFGRDREDASSVGGFSQREIDLLADILIEVGV